VKEDLSGYARKISEAQAVLGWERLWRLAWPIPAWIALFAALALLDIGLIVGIVRLFAFRWPNRPEAQRRLEADSGFSHRPLSQLDDRPAALPDDGMAAHLWALQRQRGLALLARLRLAPPAPGLPARDPWGLRFAPLLLLAIGIAVGRHDPEERLWRALDPGADANAPPPLLQIWVTPPSYTGLSPMMLKPGYDGAPIHIPAGSKMLAELQGAPHDARLAIDDERQDFNRLDAQSQKIETEITHGHSLSVKTGWRRLGRWPIAVIVDHPPSVAFVDPPQPLPEGKLQIKVAAIDDYGVAELGLILVRQDAGGESEIRLPAGGQKDVTFDQALDLSANPWSGLRVTVRPVARDGAGQNAEGEDYTITLSERRFNHPVARAIAAVRHHLIANPTARLPVSQAIATIADHPDSWGGDLTVFLDLATGRARLLRDDSDAAVPSVIDMLWAAAIRVEQGDLQDARDEVDRAVQALQDALAKGASDDEITRLTQQLNGAVARLMQSLARNGANQQQQQGTQQGGRSITPQQLQAMLNQLNDLAHSGARQAARQSLDALRALLSQLQAGGAPSPGAQRMSRSMQALQDLAERQRSLLDRSFKRQQQQRANGNNNSGDLPELGKFELQLEDQLRNELQQLMNDNPEAGSAAPALDQALRSMSQATQSLQQGQGQAAMDAEGRALDRLQEGERQLGKAMKEGGEGAAGANGSGGNDPLGRVSPSNGALDGNGTKVPSQGDIGKAREILDDLRRRAADAERPSAERDYLRRLLDRLY
jgi:uncharacterized protein (TIGR02302 family)